MSCFKKKGRNRFVCHPRSCVILRSDSCWSGPSGAACLLLLKQDRVQRSSLCGGKLLGLRPHTFLIVHPVLTETQTERDVKR